jgi:hypothetical protein
MDPFTIISLSSSLTSKIASEAILKALSTVLKEKGVQITATDEVSLKAELTANADVVRGEESPEESSRSTRRVIENTLSILEKERKRLTPIATREHWVALIFAVIAGVIFLGTIVLAAFGSVQQAVVSLAASAIPGFLSAVFFAREAKMETRIAQITGDVRESEKVRERLAITRRGAKACSARKQSKTG